MAKKPIPVNAGGIIKLPIPITISAIARRVNKIAISFVMVLIVWFICIQGWDGPYFFYHPRLFVDSRRLEYHIFSAGWPDASGSRS